MTGKRLLTAALGVVLLTGCGSPPASPSASPPASPSAAGPLAAAPPAGLPSGTAGLPDGWRWESYGGVQVGVPGAWIWGERGLRLEAWCIDQDRPPAVVRPTGLTPLVGCMGGETLIKNTGSLVAFGQSDTVTAVPEEGDRTTVRLNGVEVVVQAPKQTRDRIVATIQRTRIDVYGCPEEPPTGTDPSARPKNPVDVATLRDVTSVSVCRYDFGGGVLLSGWRLDGDTAATAVRGIGATAIGGETDRPQDCAPESAFGNDAIVLRIRSAAGDSDVLLRYAGCVGNGFDDGVHRRALGRAWEPFTIGPTRVTALEVPR